MNHIPVISIVAAKSGSGKTTLIEKLIAELKKGGLRVAVIKHDAHPFEVDIKGKDSYRFSKAGADIVAISGPNKAAIFHHTETEYTLDEILSQIDGVDLILTEGYKKEKYPKIEILDSGIAVSPQKELIAVVGRPLKDYLVPAFSRDDIKEIADFIFKYLKRGTFNAD